MNASRAGKTKWISTWLAIIMLIIMITLTFKPTITGLAIAPVHEQTLRIHLTQTQHFNLRHAEGERLNTLAITGNTRGKGIVDILLKENSGRTLRVYRNTHETTRGLLSVTGAFAALKPLSTDEGKSASLSIMPIEAVDENPIELSPEGGAPEQGSFLAACEETCSIPDDFGNNDYRLIVRIGPNTSLTLDTITYSVD